MRVTLTAIFFATIVLLTPILALADGPSCGGELVKALELLKNQTEGDLARLRASQEFQNNPGRYTEDVARKESKIRGLQTEIDRRNGVAPSAPPKNEAPARQPQARRVDGTFAPSSGRPDPAAFNARSLAELPQGQRYSTVTELANEVLPRRFRIRPGSGFQKLAAGANNLDGVEYTVEGVPRPDLGGRTANVRVRIHSPDVAAAKGAIGANSNSARGWTVVIEAGNNSRFRYGPVLELRGGRYVPVRDAAGELRMSWYDISPQAGGTPHGFTPVLNDGSPLSEAIMNEMHIPITH